MNLPKRIHPDPIIESACEIRYDLNIIQDATFGIIYNSLKDRYPKIEKLPILQIPEAIRFNDPKFKYQAQYKIYNDKFNVLIGAYSCSVSKRDEYPGWNKFFNEILFVFNNIKDLKIIGKLNRFGLRYIDFFENINIFEKIKLDLNINGEKKIKNNQFITILEELDDFKLLFQVSNSAEQFKENVKIKGSVLDVDIELKKIDETFFENLDSILNEAHLKSKEYYFRLLNDDFLESLNPEY